MEKIIIIIGFMQYQPYKMFTVQYNRLLKVRSGWCILFLANTTAEDVELDLTKC